MSVFPSNPIVYQGIRNFTFTCLLVTARSDDLTSALWLLNGTSVESLGLDRDEAITKFEHIGSGVGSLTFAVLGLEYNYTTIQCQGSLSSGGNSTSYGVLLLVQGEIKGSTLIGKGIVHDTHCGDCVMLLCLRY